MSMKQLAEELRELGRRTRDSGPDAPRRAMLFEAASRLASPYAWHAAVARDANRRRGLDAFGNEIINREDEPTEEEDP